MSWVRGRRCLWWFLWDRFGFYWVLLGVLLVPCEDVSMNNMHAGRKRRKPAQKGVKATPAEGAKSNPSKRHRERLNSELDRLASLLPFPEDIVSSLDKLSILRLSVSYLRSKSFFSVALQKQLPGGGDHRPGCADRRIAEGKLLLQALNGFVLVVTAEGSVFFCSNTVQDYLGFHQTDVMHQSVFELIHTEDHQEFRSNLHWALNPPPGPPADPAGLFPESVSFSSSVSYNPDQLPPENSSFLERAFVCRFRCLLDNSSGFLPLNIQGRLKFFHGQSDDCRPPQLALFAIATPLQPPAILEIRTKNMIFRTKHKLDFTPMACDAKGKIVLGYTEAELRVRGSGYQFIHAADMLYCAENHVRMIKTGESGLTVFRLLTKDNRWKWVQSNARLVYKNGKPDYIIATQRPLVEEEGGEHLRKRSMHLPFTFATGEALLYQTGYPLHGFPHSADGKTKGSKSKKGKLGKKSSDDLNPKSLLGLLMSQDESVYVCQPDPEPKTVCSKSAGLDGLMSTSSWNMGSNGEKGPNFDPLLATLDSLSLDCGESCSNSELFTALENLGLNAEDLELLLLDERMMQVDLDPNHIPTLTDLLTNHEILSYIHDSLEHHSEDAPSRSTQPDAVLSAPQRVCLTPAASPALPGIQQPIIQPHPQPVPHPVLRLSQQMQRHISAGDPLKAPPGLMHPGPVNDPTAIPSSPWGGTTENWLRPSAPLNGDLRHLNTSLQSGTRWQQLQQVTNEKASFSGSQLALTTKGSYIPSGQAGFPSDIKLGHVDYGVANGGGEVLNGLTPPDVRLHQGFHPCRRTDPQKHQQTPPCLCHGPTHCPAVQPPPPLLPGLPPFEAFCMFDPLADSKVENGVLGGRRQDAASIRTGLKRNEVEPRDLSISGPGLPALQDTQKPGFFL